MSHGAVNKLYPWLRLFTSCLNERDEMMGWTHFKDILGAHVYFTFDNHLFSMYPQHVLVIPVLNEKFLLTKHKDRGWEFPDGKLELGETVEEAATRETWEETGASIILQSDRTLDTFNIK